MKNFRVLPAGIAWVLVATALGSACTDTRREESIAEITEHIEDCNAYGLSTTLRAACDARNALRRQCVVCCDTARTQCKQPYIDAYNTAIAKNAAPVLAFEATVYQKKLNCRRTARRSRSITQGAVGLGGTGGAALGILGAIGCLGTAGAGCVAGALVVGIGAVGGSIFGWISADDTAQNSISACEGAVDTELNGLKGQRDILNASALTTMTTGTSGCDNSYTTCANFCNNGPTASATCTF